MRRGSCRRRHWRALAMLGLSSAVVACGGDGPTQPTTPVNHDVNPALEALVASGGMVTSGSTALPQGSGSLTGPGGLAMDATAGEFVQKVTLADGKVLTVAGIHVWAVPARDATAPPIDRLIFGAANTGSLTRVGPGSYAIAPTPHFDFVNPVHVYFAQARAAGDSVTYDAESGTFTITSVEYFPDVFSCADRYPSGDNVTVAVDGCTSQIGVVHGTIAFKNSRAGVTEDETEFSLPIRYESLTAHLKR